MISRRLVPVLVLAILPLGLVWLARGRVAPVPLAFAGKPTLASAVEASKRSGKPVVALVTADWCAPCQSLKRSVLTDPRIERLILEGSEPAYVDFDTSREAVAGFSIKSIPAIVVLKGDVPVARMEGLLRTESYVEWLTGTLDFVSKTPADQRPVQPGEATPAGA
jgi:thioredoxin-like negative regulator of GroEL